MDTYMRQTRNLSLLVCGAHNTLLGFARLCLVGVVCVTVVLCVTGCGERDTASRAQQTPAEAAADPFNLTGLRNAFAKASPGLQVIIDEAIGSMRAGDRGSALRQFEAILQRKDLTKEQKEALQDVVARIRGAATGTTR